MCDYPGCKSAAEEVCTDTGHFYCEDDHASVHYGHVYARTAETKYEEDRPFGEWP